MDEAQANEKLFSYGTLQQENVQLATFGRKLQGRPDALCGYRLDQIEILDAAVVATSGKTHHPMLVHTGLQADRVEGTVFLLTLQEIQQADAYEVAAYQRAQIMLDSGQNAWIYLDARTQAGGSEITS